MGPITSSPRSLVQRSSPGVPRSPSTVQRPPYSIQQVPVSYPAPRARQVQFGLGGHTWWANIYNYDSDSETENLSYPSNPLLHSSESEPEGKKNSRLRDCIPKPVRRFMPCNFSSTESSSSETHPLWTSYQGLESGPNNYGAMELQATVPGADRVIYNASPEASIERLLFSKDESSSNE